jgi:predicted GNAT family acetyltransferase
MRLATRDDVDTVARWVAAFHEEALGARDVPHAPAVAARRVAAREVVLWDDGAPRAMAARDRPTARGVAVNAVYTPPASRGRGLATALVAALSRRLLAEGRSFCVLFTDLANPTANAVYARVGYRPLGDYLHLAFDPPGPP